jgi:hypothetical protein
MAISHVSSPPGSQRVDRPGVGGQVLGIERLVE